MARPHPHPQIYKNRWHMAITAGGLLIPFLLFLLFSQAIAGITDTFLIGTGVSLVRMFIAYIIAAILGWAGAIAFYRGRPAAVALPIFDVLQSFPTFAALPLATLYFGHSNGVVIFFLVMAIIWPIFFSVISSLKLVKKDWEEAAVIANLKGFSYLRHFLLPISIPGFVIGSVIGLGDGWEALIGTEIIAGVHSGAGVYFEQYARNPQLITFGILGFLLLIFGINKIIWIPLLAKSHERMEE